MGIICGGDGEGSFDHDIGVAPGATFVVAKAMNSEGGYDSWFHECLQWMAGTGRPDVLNNSWGNSVSRTDTTFWGEIQNLRSLGIACVFAVGNNPPMHLSQVPGSFPIVVSAGGHQRQRPILFICRARTESIAMEQLVVLAETRLESHQPVCGRARC